MTLNAGSDINVLQLGPPSPLHDVTGPVVLLSSSADPASDPLAGTDVRGAWVAALASGGGSGLRINVPAVQVALAAGAVGLIVISNRTDAEWRARTGRGYAPTAGVEQEPDAEASSAPGLVEIRDQVAARALGIDPSTLRATERPAPRLLEGITLTLRVRERVVSAGSAPNVIGILEGSDPKLKNEYVFFTAHMDHLGVASPKNLACRAQGGTRFAMAPMTTPQARRPSSRMPRRFRASSLVPRAPSCS